MRKALYHLLIVASLVFATLPASDASASTIPVAQQRIEIDVALDVVIADLNAEIALLQAQIAGLTPGDPQIIILQGQINILAGRISLAEAIQLQLPYLPGSVLNRIIVRFDLPVSLS